MLHNATCTMQHTHPISCTTQQKKDHFSNCPEYICLCPTVIGILKVNVPSNIRSFVLTVFTKSYTTQDHTQPVLSLGVPAPVLADDIARAQNPESVICAQFEIGNLTMTPTSISPLVHPLHISCLTPRTPPHQSTPNLVCTLPALIPLMY